MKTLDRIKLSLKKAFIKSLGESLISSEREFYVNSIDDNLVPGVKIADFWDDLAQGDGTELQPRDNTPPKFCALFSSSALVVNTFGLFKHSTQDMVIHGETGFREIGFEFKCRNGLRGMNPNLDLLALSGSKIVGVESKFTEVLSSKPAKFSEAYQSAVQVKLGDDPWADMFHSLKSNPNRFKFLDAAQLVKHALGLTHHFSSEEKSLALFYLYWEPMNTDDVKEFSSHREEVKEFELSVKNSSLTFRAMSYLELWSEWGRIKDNFELTEHLKQVRQRYQVNI